MGNTVRKTNSSTGGPVFVDVKDDKIIRVMPMDLSSDDAESWTIEARGRKFSPPRRTTVTSYTQGFKSMIYSDKRILYPMKRVDFDPNGERNPQNRGISGYERISWDEAMDIVVNEMNRIKREYGPGCIVIEPSSHHLWGNVGYRHSSLFRFANFAGITYADHNPDSWEGWHWGAAHVYGFTHSLGNPEQCDLLEDGLQNTEMVVFWSSDPETNAGIYSAYESTSRRQWLKELGVDMVFIYPFYNHTAALFNDKWFSPRVGTDAALAAGIAYVWITEDLYDKEYIATRTDGFDEFKDYILGKTDGQPKDPAWTENETGIPACDIKALARQWGKKKTTLAAGGLGGWGGACRSAIGMEWTRMMVALAAMQGMGKPGQNIWSTTQGAPRDHSFFFPGYAEGGISGDCENSAAGFQFVYRMFDGVTSKPAASNLNTAAGNYMSRLLWPECVLNDETRWHGKGFVGASIEQQFHEYKYPANGFNKIQMWYRYGGSHFGTMGETNRYVRAYRSEKLPFVVNQSIWFEGEAKFADIIFPACTNFERWDISDFANCSGYIPAAYTQSSHRVISLQQKCIEPLGESKSDYQIFYELSKRLGIDGPFAEGKDELGWIKQYFHATDLPKYITWEEFFEKGYFVVPSENRGPSTPAMRWYAEDRVIDTPDWGPRPGDTVGMKGLQTQSGKIEFVSNSLKRYDPNDQERPPLTQYIPSWEGHHTERFKKYPLAIVAPHPRFSFHTMGDQKDSYMMDIKDHRVEINGHYYWIIRMNTKDAEARGIKHHDLVKAYNERGAVILVAQLTERVPEGTCHSYESCADYEVVSGTNPGDPTAPDIMGCINQLSPGRTLAKKATGMATEHMLVEIEKWNG